MSNDYSIGIEEEFFLSDSASGLIVPRAPAGFVRACDQRVAGHATYELMQSQIETTTPVCHETAELRTRLTDLRSELGAAAAA